MSLIIVLDQVEGTLVAGTKLVVTITWVHAVVAFAGTCVNIGVAFGVDWSEVVVDYGRIYINNTNFVVEFFGVSEAALADLSNSWCE